MNKKSVYRNQEKTLFFIFEKCQRNLQNHFSVLRNASAICKAIFHFCEMPAQFAKPFFIFRKCQRNLQSHFFTLSFPDFDRRFFFISRNYLRFL